MEKLILSCIMLGLAISAIFIPLLRRSEKKRLVRAVPLVEDRFKLLSLYAENPRYGFDARTAVSVHDFAIWAGEPGNDKVFLNRICKNPYGEYFHVVISEEGSYIKHLTEERAALALKGVNGGSNSSMTTAQSGVGPEGASENFEPTASPSADVTMKIQGARAENPKPGMDGEGAGANDLRHKLARLPIGTTWFPSSVAFVVTFLSLILGATYNGQFEAVNLTRLMVWLAKVVTIFILLTLLVKWWMGKRWNSKHWLMQIVTFLVHSGYGIVIAAGVYDILVLMITRK